MSTELKPFEEREANLLEVPATSRLAVATAIANQLSEVVKKQKLYSPISGRDYVHVDGWVLLGSLCGLTPREVSVDEDTEGNVFAKVEILNSEGTVISGATSMVGMDEPTWARRPRYARRSMAVTRATGKAFRLCLSWVMQLAGFESTPFEEMPAETPPKETVGQDAPAGISLRDWQQRIENCTRLEHLDGVVEDFTSMAPTMDEATRNQIISWGKARRSELTSTAEPPW